MFRCFPGHYPQSTVSTKCFALRQVHLRAWPAPRLRCFSLPKEPVSVLGKYAQHLPCTHSGIIAFRSLKKDKNLTTWERVDQETEQIGLKKVPYSLLSLAKKKNLFSEEKYTRFQEIKEVMLA